MNINARDKVLGMGFLQGALLHCIDGAREGCRYKGVFVVHVAAALVAAISAPEVQAGPPGHARSRPVVKSKALQITWLRDGSGCLRASLVSV